MWDGRRRYHPASQKRISFETLIFMAQLLCAARSTQAE